MDDETLDDETIQAEAKLLIQELAAEMGESAAVRESHELAEYARRDESLSQFSIIESLAYALKEVTKPTTFTVPTPVVNVHVPEQPAPQVTVNVPAPVVHVNVPQQPAPEVIVNVPEQPAPTVEVAAPPPAQVQVTLEMPERTVKIQRDKDGKITGAEVS